MAISKGPLQGDACICAGAGDAAAADARSGRKTVDLENLAFAQGGHLNTNKNTNLPPGSTRTTDKVRDHRVVEL